MTQQQKDHGRAWSPHEPQRYNAAPSEADDIIALMSGLIESHHGANQPRDAGAQREAQAHYAGRIEALQVAALTVGAIAEAADLELMIRDTLRAFSFGAAPQIAIGGPTVLIRAAPARMLMLVLHELATNAIKFGALGSSSTDQTLQIQWRHIATDVEIRWQEHGVPPVRAESRLRSGFGRTLIETFFPLHFFARTKFQLLQDGICCSIILPQQALTS